MATTLVIDVDKDGKPVLDHTAIKASLPVRPRLIIVLTTRPFSGQDKLEIQGRLGLLPGRLTAPVAIASGDTIGSALGHIGASAGDVDYIAFSQHMPAPHRVSQSQIMAQRWPGAERIPGASDAAMTVFAVGPAGAEKRQ